MKIYCCPHCGWRFSAAAKRSNNGLVPSHLSDCGDRDKVKLGQCPGSDQIPRNAEADRRPLWKDGGVK